MSCRVYYIFKLLDLGPRVKRGLCAVRGRINHRKSCLIGFKEPCRIREAHIPLSCMLGLDWPWGCSLRTRWYLNQLLLLLELLEGLIQLLIWEHAWCLSKFWWSPHRLLNVSPFFNPIQLIEILVSRKDLQWVLSKCEVHRILNKFSLLILSVIVRLVLIELLLCKLMLQELKPLQKDRVLVLVFKVLPLISWTHAALLPVSSWISLCIWWDTGRYLR